MQSIIKLELHNEDINDRVGPNKSIIDRTISKQLPSKNNVAEFVIDEPKGVEKAKRIKFLGHKCDLCNIPVIFKHRKYFLNHLSKKHPDVAKYTCKTCKMEFTMYRKYRQHRVIHHIDELYPYSCITCGSKFLRRNQLTEHRVTEHPKKIAVIKENAKCDICNKQFETSIAKYQHIKVDHADVRFKCRICKSSFSAHKNRARHEVEVHRRNIDNPEQFFECDICDKAYVTIYTMTQHMLTHKK